MWHYLSGSKTPAGTTDACAFAQICVDLNECGVKALSWMNKRFKSKLLKFICTKCIQEFLKNKNKIKHKNKKLEHHCTHALPEGTLHSKSSPLSQASSVPLHLTTFLFPSVSFHLYVSLEFVTSQSDLQSQSICSLSAFILTEKYVVAPPHTSVSTAFTSLMKVKSYTRDVPLWHAVRHFYSSLPPLLLTPCL